MEQRQMSDSNRVESERDLTAGVSVEKLAEGEPFFGQVGDDAVYLVRDGEDVRAFGASCTHYGAPLSDGLLHAGILRCPWHHARFSVSDGGLCGGPALDSLPRFEVEVKDGSAFVGRRLEREQLAAPGSEADGPESVVIIGAGAAGIAAAETLRREGYRGPIALVDPDPDAPYDRPNLSKAYLSGEAPEEWLPLRDEEFLATNGIERVLARAVGIDRENRTVELDSGKTLTYGAVLLAPGSSARTLELEGADLPHVHTLRSLEDCRAIIEAAEESDRAVVVGASFIGMEVAAALTARGLDVSVVAPDEVPFARTLGSELGGYLRDVHEEQGVDFHLGRTARRIEENGVVLDDGTRVGGDLVVLGVGAVPELGLAEAAGLELDDGILVDDRLRSSDPHVYAAGDVARFPDPRSGRPIRIEHWVVAGRQGRTAARNILGHDEPFRDPPFFWTRQFGQSVAYVGHAVEWERTEIEGDCQADGCEVAFVSGGRRLALGTLGRAEHSLRAEVEWEREVGQESLRDGA
jgi:NADPH-dependent 2,4-dienoyl-CoA reductase/sulfur reductase-like enzyme/nitrite reductase/ring-hydroxylating ferredoxin subunit